MCTKGLEECAASIFNVEHNLKEAMKLLITVTISNLRV
jgi:hypothetical protein